MTPLAATRIGNTITFTSAAAAPTGVQCSGGGNMQATTYELVNEGAQIAFFASGATASAAQAAAVLPPGAVWAVLPGAARYVTDIPNAFWSAITRAGTGACEVTPVA
jgi:hypothetical protein